MNMSGGPFFRDTDAHDLVEMVLEASSSLGFLLRMLWSAF